MKAKNKSWARLVAHEKRKHHLTTHGLAKVLGAGLSTVANWLSGRNRPSGQYRTKLMRLHNDQRLDGRKPDLVITKPTVLTWSTRLKACMEKLGWNTRQLATRLGVPHGTVMSWLGSRYQPNKHNAELLAYKLRKWGLMSGEFPSPGPFPGMVRLALPRPKTTATQLEADAKVIRALTPPDDPKPRYVTVSRWLKNYEDNSWIGDLFEVVKEEGGFMLLKRLVSNLGYNEHGRVFNVKASQVVLQDLSQGYAKLMLGNLNIM